MSDFVANFPDGSYEPLATVNLGVVSCIVEPGHTAVAGIAVSGFDTQGVAVQEYLGCGESSTITFEYVSEVRPVTEKELAEEIGRVKAKVASLVQAAFPPRDWIGCNLRRPSRK